jgi:16S rRNA (cytosine967-C5)-methyltransferase
MGVLRWRSLLDRRLAFVSSQKLERLDDEVLAALRLGIYQFQFLSRIPARAAIFESVELVKAARKGSSAAFVNAVLRKVGAAVGGETRTASTSAEDSLAAIDGSADAHPLAQSSAHPEWLVARWAERYGLEAARQICLNDQHPPETTLRLYGEDVAEKLKEQGIQLGPGRLLTAARVVLSGDVTQTGAYRQRLISIQDEASQLVAMLVGRGESILDCCAAPGGKTAVLASRNPKSTIVAAELHPHRARLLRRLVQHSDVRVVGCDARQLPFSAAFDRILADVPCSGTGTLARNPEIKWRLTPGDLQDLQSRQIAILKSALVQLARGGRLVYSTCSLEREENEDVVEAALGGASEFAIGDCRAELEELQRSGELRMIDFESLLSGPYLRTIPGVHPCDGFFAAIIEKK